ncbi:MAG TPA: hypothetical protein DCQ15_02415 [Chitinophagaceae bacterium]|jgi:F0F1-type ATP synthase assembly protein I|nr:hypothetical protein [Chitinophagaceae bacterium]
MDLKHFQKAMAKSLLVSLIYTISIGVLVGILLDILVFKDYSLLTIITPVLAGIPTGYFFHKVLKEKHYDN